MTIGILVIRDNCEFQFGLICLFCLFTCEILKHSIMNRIYIFIYNICMRTFYNNNYYYQFVRRLLNLFNNYNNNNIVSCVYIEFRIKYNILYSSRGFYRKIF